MLVRSGGRRKKEDNNNHITRENIDSGKCDETR